MCRKQSQLTVAAALEVHICSRSGCEIIRKDHDDDERERDRDEKKTIN